MFLKESRYGGIDWHDANTRSVQLSYNNNFDIPNDKLLEVAINKIVEDWKQSVKLTTEEFQEIIKKAFTGTEPITIPLLDENGKESDKDDSTGIIYYENCLTFFPITEEDDVLCRYDEDYSWGQVSFSINYYKENIKDPCYVGEYSPTYRGGCFLVFRTKTS